MNSLYNVITESFLEKFDLNWNNMLSEIKCQQIQLTEGNRLRPQICLWGYLSTFPILENFNKDLSKIAYVSVSIEMIHKASIMIDDWIDEDFERHGVPAFHTEFSPQNMVITALTIIGLALKRLKKNTLSVSANLPHYYFMCLDTLIDTIYAMAQGALKEIYLNDNNIYEINTIKEIMQLETAEIIGNSMLIGYYTGIDNKSLNPDIVNTFKKIGDLCGCIFQTMNDLEFFANSQKLYAHKGNFNSDIMNKRKNIVIATLYDIASEKDKHILALKPEECLQSLVVKYQILELFSYQLNDLFLQLIKIVKNLKNENISNEWITGFIDFLYYIKEFGENRLKT